MKTKNSELKVPTWQDNKPWARKVKSTFRVHIRRKGSFRRILGREVSRGEGEGIISISPDSLLETAVYSCVFVFRKNVRAIQRDNRIP